MIEGRGEPQILSFGDSRRMGCFVKEEACEKEIRFQFSKDAFP